MVKTINEWVQVGSSFVKDLENGVYEIVRIEQSNTNSDNIYYDYYTVAINNVSEETFSNHGDYNEYLALETIEEKVAYAAFHGHNSSTGYTLEDYTEVTNCLQEDGIILSGVIVEFKDITV